MLRGDADYINEGFFFHPREIFITMRGLQKVGCFFYHNNVQNFVFLNICHLLI